MWGTFDNLAQRAKAVADKAKAVAADLEGQLDKSVGIEGTTEQTTSIDGDSNGWNDDFPSDDDLVDTTTITRSTSTTSMTQQTVSNELAGSTADNNTLKDAPSGPTAVVQEEEEVVDRVVDRSEHSSAQDTTEASTSNQQPIPFDNSDRVEDDIITNRGEPESWTPIPPVTSQAPTEEESTTGGPVSPQQDEGHTQISEEAGETTEIIDHPTSANENDEEIADGNPPISSGTSDETTANSEPYCDGGNQQANLHTMPLNNPSKTTLETIPGDGNNQALLEQVASLQTQLRQREEQLFNKTEQITSMQNMSENMKQDLEQKLENTKEEAKRRLAKARERVEAAEKRAASLSSSSSDAAAQNDEVIAALRAEGEKLAHKQLEMEKAVRTAKGESRELREKLDLETEAKNNALERISKLEADLKETKAELAAARKGVSQASKLEVDLQSAREDTERKSATILSLEQQVKELKASAKELNNQLGEARKGAALDSEREQKKLKKEHISMLEDLETKLRTTEKEAAVREDALRHEVSELRKRWQDAVRRADSLSLDVQSSTAPLLRQLESMERQNRTRASGWANLESKLRQELEDTVAESEKLQKERNELKSKSQRLERQFSEIETEFQKLQASHEENTKTSQLLQSKLSETESLHETRRQEWDESHRLANEGVARVRSEMAQTVMEAEERHASQLDSLDKELRQEREKRRQLEEQVQGLLDKATAMVLPNSDDGNLAEQMKLQKPPPKELGSGQGQAEILAGALTGLGEDDDDGDDGETERTDDPGGGDLVAPMNGGNSSFAAMEALLSQVKVTNVELNTLRKSLAESEKSREKLVTELAEARHAKERLPVVENMLEQKSRESDEKSLEIQGLHEDIGEVRELYRSQLNVLLEEKTSSEDNHLSQGDGIIQPDQNTA